MCFCNSCGILLPADFDALALMCNACTQLHTIYKRARYSRCNCEFCGEPSVKILTFNNNSTEVESRTNNEYQYPITITSSSPALNEKKGQLSDDRICSDESLMSPESFDCNKDAKGSDPVFRPPEIDSYGSSFYENLISPDVWNQKYIHNIETSDSKWGLVSTKNKGHKKNADPTTSNVCTSSRSVSSIEPRWEDLVAEDIREKWTREQTEYLKKLVTEDTPTIQRLISGVRRRKDGHHFYVGGVDISFIKDNSIDACACLSVVQMPSLKLAYQRMEMIKLTQPYIPGFLAFREVPPLLGLFERLEKAAPQFKPDVVMVDGNGILHPRGFGLASQLGVDLDMPTIGVAKTLMTAQGVTDDAEHKKKKQSLTEGGHGFDLISHTTGKVIGKCLRVHDDATNPVYVSIGHKISLKAAAWIVLENSKYRIPEPVRRADLDSREYIRQNKRSPSEFILSTDDI